MHLRHSLLVCVERLRDGKIEYIRDELDPAGLDIADEELCCKGPVFIEAEVSLVDIWILVKISLRTSLVLPCAVCNETFVFNVKLDHFQHEEPLENISADVYDLIPLVREMILVEVPFYPQCAGNSCRNRKSLEKYIRYEGTSEEDGYQPFKELL
jgi:uncharacterized metal-binding protein YceD (DUF177 family)